MKKKPTKPEAEDRQVRRHHVRRVLRPAEAGLDHGETGLHEDHQRRADDDPQQVEAEAIDARRHGCGRVEDRRILCHRDGGCGQHRSSYDQAGQQLRLAVSEHQGVLLN